MPLAIITAASLLGLAGQASAVPIEITGSEFTVDYDWGGSLADYYDDNTAGPIELAQGDSETFHFGTYYSGALGGGTAEFLLHLATPSPEGAVGDSGEISIFSIVFATVADLSWGSPVQVAYSFGGLAGGILELNMHNFHDVTLGGLNVVGTITNVMDPTRPVAVPEPGLLLLLGGGLLAVATARRRKIS